MQTTLQKCIANDALINRIIRIYWSRAIILIANAKCFVKGFWIVKYYINSFMSHCNLTNHDPKVYLISHSRFHTFDRKLLTPDKFQFDWKIKQMYQTSFSSQIITGTTIFTSTNWVDSKTRLDDQCEYLKCRLPNLLLVFLKDEDLIS